MPASEPALPDAPPGNSSSEILWRGRIPIAATLTLAGLEAIGIRFGSFWAMIALIGLVALPVLAYGFTKLGHSLPLALLSIFLLVVGSLGLSQLMDPLAALGVSFIAATAVVARVWRFGLRHLMLLVVAAAVLIRVGLVFGTAGPGFLLVLTLPLVIVGGFLVLFRQRTYEREALVEALELAARSQTPLGPAAEAFGSLCSPGFRKHVNQLANRLNEGVPLAEALKSNPSVATSETRLYAGVGSSWSLLDQTLGAAVNASRARNENPVSLWNVLAYPLGLMVAIAHGANFVLFFITPNIQMIARDFGLPGDDPAMGPLTWAMGSGRFLPLSFWLSTFLALVTLGIILSTPIIALKLLRARILTPAGWLGKKRQSATMLRALAIGIDQNRPLPEVLQDLGRATSSAWLRKKLSRVRNDVTSGRPWPQALQKRGLIGGPERAVLSAAERAGNLPWAVQEMATSLENRYKQRIRLLGLLLQPVVLLAIGGFVLLIALTYFLPILAIMQRFAEDLS